MNGMDPATATNRLLRNQLRDMAGHLLTLTERACLLTQDMGRTERDVYGRSERDIYGGWDEPPTNRFVINGRRSDFYRGMPPPEWHTYRETIDAARRVERQLAEERAQWEHLRLNPHHRRPQPYPEEGPFGGNRIFKRPKAARETAYTPAKKPKPPRKPCIICGKAHLVTDCPWKLDHCFRCGKPGHLRAFCPQKPTATPTPPQREDRGTTAATAPQEDQPDDQHDADLDEPGPPPGRVVRRWPKGCGRGPRTTQVEDAMSRKD